jgi:hypothetical protein
MQDSGDQIKSVLRRVKAGEQSFGPADDSMGSLREFQLTVKCLKAAGERGLIESVVARPPSKTRDMYGLVQLVLVSGGLTLKGEEFLLAPSASPAWKFRKWATDGLTQLIIAVAGGLVVIYLAAKWL